VTVTYLEFIVACYFLSAETKERGDMPVQESFSDDETWMMGNIIV